MAPFSFGSDSLGKPAKNGAGAVGFGCMGITAFYGSSLEDDAAFALLKTVYDAGCRHFDTAEVYKAGDPMKDEPGDKWNEAQIGKFLQTVPRDSFTVATKFFPHKYEGKCDYDTVKASLLNSLKRLGLAYVDLYYCHRIPSFEAALAFTKAANRLKAEGYIRAIGLSEIIGSWLKKCCEISHVDAVQQEWSLLTRNLEDELVPVCVELGVAIVAYSPLGRNLLTGVVTEAPTDWRATNPRYSKENLDANLKLIKDVEALAEKKGATPAQLSLAWLFEKAKRLNVRVVPIPGTTKSKHALSNIAAADVEVNDDEMHLLEEIASKVAGDRGDDTYKAMGIEAQLLAAEKGDASSFEGGGKVDIAAEMSKAAKDAEEASTSK